MPSSLVVWWRRLPAPPRSAGRVYSVGGLWSTRRACTRMHCGTDLGAGFDNTIDPLCDARPKNRQSASVSLTAHTLGTGRTKALGVPVSPGGSARSCISPGSRPATIAIASASTCRAILTLLAASSIDSARVGAVHHKVRKDLVQRRRYLARNQRELLA